VLKQIFLYVLHVFIGFLGVTEKTGNTPTKGGGVSWLKNSTINQLSQNFITDFSSKIAISGLLFYLEKLFTQPQYRAALKVKSVRDTLKSLPGGSDADAVSNCIFQTMIDAFGLCFLVRLGASQFKTNMFYFDKGIESQT
jgi:hypothetical protein